MMLVLLASSIRSLTSFGKCNSGPHCQRILLDQIQIYSHSLSTWWYPTMQYLLPPPLKGKYASWLSSFPSRLHTMMLFNMCRYTRHDLVGTPSGLFFPLALGIYTLLKLISLNVLWLVFWFFQVLILPSFILNFLYHPSHSS